MSDPGLRTRKGSRNLVSCYLEDARRAHHARTTEPPRRRGGKNARISELVEPHLFYVVQVASEFQSRDIPFEELLAEGNMGLVEAAHRFDPTHEVKFLTYASWWIRKRILDYITREGKSVRLTRYARERRRDLRVLREALARELKREPTPEELSRTSGLGVEAVLEHSSGNLRVISIDEEGVDESSSSMIERLTDRKSIAADDLLDRRRVQLRVRREIARLPYRERLIIENRFGLDGRDAMTFQQLGTILGLSRERARQIEQEAMTRLRRRLSRLHR